VIFKGKSKDKDAFPGREEPFGWTADEQARWEKGQQTDHFRSLWKESKKNKKNREAELQEIAMDVARAREAAARKGQRASIENAAAPAPAPAGSTSQSLSRAPAELSLGERLRAKREASEAAKGAETVSPPEDRGVGASAQREVSPQAELFSAAPPALEALNPSRLSKEELLESLLDGGDAAPGRGVASPVGASASASLGEPKAVALFDFDGTLTNLGTIGLFFIAAAGPFKVLARARDLIEDRKALKAGTMSFEETLAHAGEWFLGDLSEEQMRAAGARVLRWLRWIPRGWNKKSVARLESLKKLGAHVELVSGSFPWVAQEAARDWEVECLCSEWMQTEGGWTLKKAMVETAKGERVDELRARWPSATILAFGNSFGDKQMLMKADEAWFVAGKNKAPAKINRMAVAALQP